ncbi:MAG: polyphosphate kinase 1 [Pseudoflavonifractor sp.]|nr:polyphosphate kinase 1 [Pseudoflavonifractor sp.]
MSTRDNVDTRYTQERELAWLKFNERVMEEAWDENVPLFERLKFAAIFTSNLDEFFMIRVGSIGDMALIKEPHVDNKSGLTPAQQLAAVFQAVPPLYRRRDKLFFALEKRLRACNVCNLEWSELDGRERRQVEYFFRESVSPILSPLVVDAHHPFPHLPTKQLNVALSLKRDGKEFLGLIPIPRSLPPFLQLEERGLRYLLTEQVVLTFAHELFESYSIGTRAVISVTRNADISPEDEDSETEDDFRQHMKHVLKKRARLAPVRLEYQGDLASGTLLCLRQRLGLSEERIFHSKAPLSLDYIYALESKLPPESRAALTYPTFTPGWPAGLSQTESMIPQILQRDALLFYPYHSMEPFLRLVREAAADPKVLSIKITIYRLASKAKLVESLCTAAENGKDVTVLMELRARFDEQNNIQWAERLEEAGCTLIYGIEGYKVHSKVCLITRRDRGRVQCITQIGTGNYNEKTVRLYTDFCLMTSSPAIGADAAAFFQNLSTGNLEGEYRLLLVSPHSLRPALLNFIDEEIAKGTEGFLFLKMNSITDRVLIDKLAQASQAGVNVLMNVRGICCLRPGVPGLTDHIRVFSIVGRFLEHPRVFIFGKGEDARMYIGSADFMTRNTQRRVEIACPILDPDVRRDLAHDIDMLCRDNVKARLIGPDGSWSPVPRLEGEAPVDAQAVFLQEALREQAEVSAVPPPAPPEKNGFFTWLKRRLGRA